MRHRKASITHFSYPELRFFATGLLAVLFSTPAAALQDTDPPVFVSGPVLLPNPNPEVPLSAMIALETDEPTQVRLALWDGQTDTGLLLADADFELVHSAVPVVGMRPNRTYRIKLTVVDAAGNVTVGPPDLVFHTPPLPTGFPRFQVTVSKPDQMEPGVTLVTPVESRADTSWLVMLDAAGEVVWYYESVPERRLGDARRMDSGNLLLTFNRDLVAEIDLLGNVVGEWKATNITGPADGDVVPLLTDSIHHEVIELPDHFTADFAVLSTELQTYPNYPASVVDQAQQDPMTDVIGDVIVEFKRDGTIVNEWKLLDLLDPYRVSYDSLSGFWDTHYGTSTADWSHANAVILDESDDSYIVSLRHQEAVIKVDRQTGELTWILGDPSNWVAPWDSKLLAQDFTDTDFNWSYHQHAPQITPDGLMLFDNGNGRAVAPNPELPAEQRFSRAVEFRLDPDTMLLEQVWSYHRNIVGELPWYSAFLGDADRLSDTVLVTDGGKLVPGGSVTFARIAEVTYASPPEIVFEVIIKDPSPLQPHAVGWTAYRSERLPGVYPFHQ